MSGDRPVKKVVAWVFAAIGLVSLVASFALDITRGLSISRSLTLAVIYFLMLAVLLRTDVVRLPPKLYVPFVSGFAGSEFAKAIGCFFAACLWAYTGARLASGNADLNDSWWGVAVVAGPPILLILAGMTFLYRSATSRNR